MSQLFETLAKDIETGNQTAALEHLKEGIDAKLDVERLMNDGLIKGMDTLGERWKRNEVFVPEVLIAARALTACLEILRPLLEASGVKPKGKALIGTVKGDLHDIGKNLVKMMMIGAGFEVIDLGVDVNEDVFVEQVKAEKPDVLLLSALLTTTMGQQETVVKALQAAGVKDTVKVMIGGAPVTAEFAEEIGADAYTADAASAAERAIEFVAQA